MKKVIFVLSFLLLFTDIYSQWFYQNNPDSIPVITSGTFINSNTGWYARSKGEISKTTDGGITWNTYKADVNDLNSIKFVNANTGYVCGNNGRLLKSVNGGLNWSIQNPSSNDTLVSIDFINELTGWCAGRDFIIHTSNGGSQWYKQNVDTNIVKPRFSVIKMYDSQNGLAGAFNKQNFTGDYAYIYRTSNGGINWYFSDSIYGYRTYSICYVNQNIVFLSTYFSLYKSIYGGSSWNFISNISNTYTTKLQFVNENTGWYNKFDLIFKTTNGGVNWYVNSSYLRGIICDLNYTSNGNIFAVTSKGSVYKTTNEGTNWRNYSANIESDLHVISIVDANNVFVGGDYGSVWKSTNGGLNWQNKFRDSIGSINGPYFVNSNTGFLISAQCFLYKSTNSGENWFKIETAFPHNVKSILCSDENNLWVLGDSGMILRTTNSGINWESKSINTPSLVYGLKENNNILFIQVFNFDSSFYKSTNQGNNWINIPLDSIQSSFNLNFLNSQIGWVTPIQGNIFYKTFNGGNTWIKYNRSIENLVVYSCFVNENTGYAVSFSYYNGLIKTTNSGFTWFTLESFPYYNNYYTTNVAFLNENTGWVVGQSGLILKTTNAGTSFISVNNQNIPEKFLLSQNYPNPFNPTTKIRYQIAKTGFVTLKVYNILGKEIATLVNEKLGAGEYEVQFPNVQVANVQLHSGVYFYKLTCGEFSETKKMVLLK